mmetsp:Transcript_972/g.2012  ORF Transcript_972/g.2012 Transcript_972/m.2012 type:complete len:231 (+) Transcript_972:2166-2858(+)
MPRPWMSKRCLYCSQKAGRCRNPSGPRRCMIQDEGGQYRQSPPMSFVRQASSSTHVCESTANPKSMSQKVVLSTTVLAVVSSWRPLIRMLCELMSLCHAMGARLSKVGANCRTSCAAKAQPICMVVDRVHHAGPGFSIKTSNDSPGATVIAIRTRPPSGVCDTLYEMQRGIRIWSWLIPFVVTDRSNSKRIFTSNIACSSSPSLRPSTSLRATSVTPAPSVSTRARHTSL